MNDHFLTHFAMRGDLPNPANSSRVRNSPLHCTDPSLHELGDPRYAHLTPPVSPPNLLIAERILEILPALHTTSVDVHLESKARITQLADTEAVGVWQRYGDDGSEDCWREFTKH